MHLSGSLQIQRRGNEAGEGSRKQVLWGAAEGTGVVNSGEEQTYGGTLLVST